MQQEASSSSLNLRQRLSRLVSDFSNALNQSGVEQSSGALIQVSSHASDTCSLPFLTANWSHGSPHLIDMDAREGSRWENCLALQQPTIQRVGHRRPPCAVSMRLSSLCFRNGRQSAASDGGCGSCLLNSAAGDEQRPATQ